MTPAEKAHRALVKSRWRQRNRTRLNAKDRKYYRKHRKERLAYVKANSHKYRLKHRLAKFGLTVEQYHRMLTRQKNACAICKAKRPGGRGRWCVDHDHKTGKVRGLLCVACNLGIGHLRDNIVILRLAIVYLRRTKGF